MGHLQETGHKISNALAIATDWLLIGMGLLLILIALKSIDVMVARYVVISGGIMLTGIGFWYRYRRLKRKRQRDR
jgi:small neutral amino acid transporter SnatA (MarC family)